MWKIPVHRAKNVGSISTKTHLKIISSKLSLQNLYPLKLDTLLIRNFANQFERKPQLPFRKRGGDERVRLDAFKRVEKKDEIQKVDFRDLTKGMHGVESHVKPITTNIQTPPNKPKPPQNTHPKLPQLPIQRDPEPISLLGKCPGISGHKNYP
jgi:hypothetical protein